jgi:hypothetical protein
MMKLFPLFYFTAAISARKHEEDDGSIVLRILQPHGTVKRPPPRQWQDELGNLRRSEPRNISPVEIDIEAFAGSATDLLRADPSAWELCYNARAARVPASYNRVAATATTATTLPRQQQQQQQQQQQKARKQAASAAATSTSTVCVDMTLLSSGLLLPPLELPEQAAAVVGLREHWRFDAWLNHKSSSRHKKEEHEQQEIEVVSEGGGGEVEELADPSAMATTLGATYVRWQLQAVREIAAQGTPAAGDGGGGVSDNGGGGVGSGGGGGKSRTGELGRGERLAENIQGASSSSGGGAGYRIKGGGLFTELQVLSLDPTTARLALPPEFKRIWVEVSYSTRRHAPPPPPFLFACSAVFCLSSWFNKIKNSPAPYIDALTL